jgi:pyrroloquinoline quinone (PQQ) biosynthesis protein C
MDATFERLGPLKELTSYPTWLQRVVTETNADKQQILGHAVFAQMRDATLPQKEFAAFLVNGWPVVEQFPQYMSMNLLKLSYGESKGKDMARRYLTRNIRVEQNHADYWVDWAAAHDVSKEKLSGNHGPAFAYALSHWCWSSSSRDSLVASIAATNYAIEGVTGEWATFVCSSPKYEESLPESIRKKAMRWLRLHAHYDDAHPWEALDIVATLLGNAPAQAEIDSVRTSIRRSYQYFKLSLDCCL